MLNIASGTLWGQIGLNTSNPDQSSKFDIYSNNKGVLFPRVSLSSVSDVFSPIVSPTIGLTIWNTNPNVINGNGIGYYYFDGISWVKIQREGSLDECYDQLSPGQGRIIIADSGALKIAGTDGFLITGTNAVGALIDSEITGEGTRMFFNPFKSAFRAGYVLSNKFDNANVGNYSFCVGYDNRIFGGKTFGANSNNETSNANASSFGNGNTSFQNSSFSSGNITRSGGNHSFATGFTTFATGYNSFTGGVGNRSNSINEVTLGFYCKTPAKTNNSGIAFTDSQSAFYTTDRAFAIGNGDVSVPKNAFEVWKNGRVMINSAYSFPTTDGVSKQTLITNGSGTLSWKTNSTGITYIPLYNGNAIYSMSNTGAALDLSGIETGLIPSIFQVSGNVKVKLVIRYASLTGTPNFRLRAHDGTTQLVPITTAVSNWVNTPTQVGGVYESTWKNWSGATGVYEVHLSGFMAAAGQSIDILNAYLMIAPQ